MFCWGMDDNWLTFDTTSKISARTSSMELRSSAPLPVFYEKAVNVSSNPIEVIQMVVCDEIQSNFIHSMPLLLCTPPIRVLKKLNLKLGGRLCLGC